MMGICPTEAQLLQMLMYMLNKSISLEDSIVCQIIIFNNTMIKT